MSDQSLREALEPLIAEFEASGRRVDALLQSLREQLADPAAEAAPAKCHRCGGTLRSDDTYTRLDGTTYHLRGCEDTPEPQPAPGGVEITDEARQVARDAAVEVWNRGSADSTQMLMAVDAALKAAQPFMPAGPAATLPAERRDQCSAELSMRRCILPEGHDPVVGTLWHFNANRELFNVGDEPTPARPALDRDARLHDLLDALVAMGRQDNGYYERQFEAPAYRDAAKKLASALGVKIEPAPEED